MDSYDVIIVGGSAAGITAALTARKHYPSRSILQVRREKLVSIPCGIPYVFGTVGLPEKNLIPTDEVLAKNGVEALVDEVTGIDRDARTVTTAAGKELGYDRLVLATGSVPIVPPIPGADKPGIFAIQKDVDYLRGVVDAFRGRAEAANVALEADLPPCPPAHIDPDRVAQVVGNLLENALRYTPEGGTVTISLRSEDGTVRISVADTGPGIDEADLPRIFERLYVAQRYRAARPEGSGLGLSIVRELAAAMGGRTEVESRAGAGTKVTVVLPRGLAAG